MNLSIRTLVSGAAWTIGAFGISQVIRFASNVILARLLAPELFGLMVIVNTLGIGMQLMSDIGIGQNIIYSKNANEPNFYNTAWTLQIIRGIGLWTLFLIAAVPVANFYNIQALSLILPISGLSILFTGFSSVSLSLLQKRMLFAKLNIFNLVIAFLSSTIIILFAYFSRTIWALVLGGVAGSALFMLGSYFLLRDLKHRFCLDKQSVAEILRFGKWIVVSSVVFFLSANFDRLYFAKIVPLELLGVYGIARTISDMIGNVANRLGWSVVFPYISSHENMSRELLRQHISPIRLKFLLLAALSCSLFIATADLAITILYDERYHAANWMLPILLIGAWFSMISTLNESTLLGLGKPSYVAMANSVKFIFLAFGLPISVRLYGFSAGIMTSLTG